MIFPQFHGVGGRVRAGDHLAFGGESGSRAGLTQMALTLALADAPQQVVVMRGQP